MGSFTVVTVADERAAQSAEMATSSCTAATGLLLLDLAILLACSLAGRCSKHDDVWWCVACTGQQKVGSALFIGGYECISIL